MVEPHEVNAAEGVMDNRKSHEARARAAVRRRRVVQWLLLTVLVVTIGAGWWLPVLGFTVPAVMLMGLVGGLIRGRYVCGYLCPRGAFFDRIVAPLRRGGQVPGFLRSMAFRWSLFAVLMGFMVFQISRNPSALNHWGRVFWLMCVVTTSVGIVGGLLVHPRFWCALCPMGTMQSALGGDRHQLAIDANTCRECMRCERACPMGLEIVRHTPHGRLKDRDCLKCGECVAVCPTSALRWPGR